MNNENSKIATERKAQETSTKIKVSAHQNDSVSETTFQTSFQEAMLLCHQTEKAEQNPTDCTLSEPPTKTFNKIFASEFNSTLK